MLLVDIDLGFSLRLLHLHQDGFELLVSELVGKLLVLDQLREHHEDLHCLLWMGCFYCSISCNGLLGEVFLYCCFQRFNLLEELKLFLLLVLELVEQLVLVFLIHGVELPYPRSSCLWA